MNFLVKHNFVVTTQTLFVFLMVMFVPITAKSDGVVIVHPSNTNELDPRAISKIFLGKRKTYPNGEEVIPLDIKAGDVIREEFVEKVLKKSNQQMKAYWSQLLFTGKGRPPTELDNSKAVKKLVSENPALIGYINAADSDSSVKVIQNF